MPIDFIENPRFPDDISYGSAFGPGYSTTIIQANSGFEYPNQNWEASRCRGDVSHGIESQAQLDVLIIFFRVCKGRHRGFRFKDWSDFQVIVANGRVGEVGASVSADGAPGTKIVQLFKIYVNAGGIDHRIIYKPVSATVQLFKNAVLMDVGTDPGEYTIDYTKGQITFAADATAAASSITPGATTQVVLPSNLGLAIGEKLFLDDFAGADAALVNDLAHTITNITGAGPFTFTLSTNTAGKTITLGTGAGFAYPQANDLITWSGQFDVPCRFDTDNMMPVVDAYNTYSWSSIPIIEIRLED